MLAAPWNAPTHAAKLGLLQGPWAFMAVMYIVDANIHDGHELGASLGPS